VILRDAVIDDLVDVFYWRNDPLSRSMSIDDKLVKKLEHKRWFESALRNPDKQMYIGISEQKKIGITRFDLNKKNGFTEVSINLNPCMRGKNLSFDLLLKSVTFYLKNKNRKLNAKVKNENLPSLKIFKKVGFIEYENDNIYKYLKFLKNQK